MIEINLTLNYTQIYFIFICLVSFLLYAYDKLQAIRTGKNISRISERTLLLSSFFGGTLGSLTAMLMFRHKIKKSSFMIKFLLVIIVQILGIYLYIKDFYGWLNLG